jgi:Protein of unknown function (DUF3105)
VQAPRTRRPERARPGRRALLLTAAAIVLAAVAAGAFLLVRSDDEDAGESVGQVLRAAGCTYREVPAVQARTHIADDDATPEEWNTDPPTSGPHFGEYVIWGEYEDPVQPARAVHNLEHGGIWISYGDEVPDAEVESLRRFYRDDPVAMLLAPMPKLGDEIVLAAWYQPAEGEEGTASGILARCTRFDEDAFESFREEWRFKGPERFAPEDLEPGE